MLTEQRASEILTVVTPNIIHIVEYLQKNGIECLQDIRGRNLEELPKLHIQLITLLRIAIKGPFPELTGNEAMHILETIFLSAKKAEWAKRVYREMLHNANKKKEDLKNANEENNI